MTISRSTEAFLACSRIGEEGPTRITRALASYPLKIVCPRAFDSQVLLAYLISYGGGLVGGDSINLRVDIGKFCTLLLLTQGSTKIFKTRSEMPLAHWKPYNSLHTLQIMNYFIESKSTLVLLPDPVTLFANSSYIQDQKFYLLDSLSSSLVLLDWYTSGRMSLGERWKFNHYTSRNEIYLNNKLLIRDILTLEGDYKNKLEKYDCYATLYLIGPSLNSLRKQIFELFDNLVINARHQSENVVWSASIIKEGGCTVRLAALTTEDARNFIKDHILKSIENVIGKDMASRILI